MFMTFQIFSLWWNLIVLTNIPIAEQENLIQLI
jgi:hypothetical protein